MASSTPVYPEGGMVRCVPRRLARWGQSTPCMCPTLHQTWRRDVGPRGAHCSHRKPLTVLSMKAAWQLPWQAPSSAGDGPRLPGWGPPKGLFRCERDSPALCTGQRAWASSEVPHTRLLGAWPAGRFVLASALLLQTVHYHSFLLIPSTPALVLPFT